jgi:hypothetical protein
MDDEFIHKIGFNGWHIGGVLGHIIPKTPIVLECITYNCAQTQTNWKKKRKSIIWVLFFPLPLKNWILYKINLVYALLFHYSFGCFVRNRVQCEHWINIGCYYEVNQSIAIGYGYCDKLVVPWRSSPNMPFFVSLLKHDDTFSLSNTHTHTHKFESFTHVLSAMTFFFWQMFYANNFNFTLLMIKFFFFFLCFHMVFNNSSLFLSMSNLIWIYIDR